MLRRAVLLFMMTIVVDCCVAQWNGGVFAGFSKLSLPRETIPLGAIWTDMGPLGTGVRQDQLATTRGISRFTESGDQAFALDVKGKMASFLSAKLGITSFQQLELRGLSIVTVVDVDVLRMNIGNQILYEGVRVDSLFFTTNKDVAASLAVQIPKALTGATIEVKSEFGKDSQVIVSGAGLYVAYRIVELERGRTKRKRARFSSEGGSVTGQTKLSSTYSTRVGDYTVTICPCEILGCMNRQVASTGQPPNVEDALAACQSNDWNITVTDLQDIRTGEPAKQELKKRWPFDIRNKSIILRTQQTSSGIESSYLDIENLHFQPMYLAGKFMAVKGADKVDSVSELIKWNAVVSKAPPGW